MIYTKLREVVDSQKTGLPSTSLEIRPFLGSPFSISLLHRFNFSMFSDTVPTRPSSDMPLMARDSRIF